MLRAASATHALNVEERGLRFVENFEAPPGAALGALDAIDEVDRAVGAVERDAASVAAHVLGCEETARFESEFRREPGRGAAGGGGGGGGGAGAGAPSWRDALRPLRDGESGDSDEESDGGGGGDGSESPWRASDVARRERAAARDALGPPPPPPPRDTGRFPDMTANELAASILQSDDLPYSPATRRRRRASSLRNGGQMVLSPSVLSPSKQQ